MGFTFPGNPFSSPGPMVPLVMFLWIPIVLYIFSRFPARRAVVISFITAWLFLPEAQLKIASGIPSYDKVSATCYGILLSTFIFDVGRFKSFKLSWIDLPMLVWCLCPYATSLANQIGPGGQSIPGEGWYDGLSATVQQCMTWGVPYFLGRIYLNNLEGLRQMAVGIFAGGVVYIPLCLFESRLSPQLHRIVYGGAAGADFGQTIRLGGFRPTVFMKHGLAVGAFMMAATLIGIWLWRSGTIKQLWGMPMQWLVPALTFTFILTRSSGAYILLGLGLVLLFVCKLFRTTIPIFLTIVAIAAYLYMSAATDINPSAGFSNALADVFPQDRVGSVQFRLDNEALLVERARESPIFGWGGWDRSVVPINPEGTKFTVQDSLWIIAFGVNGAVGLISLFTSMLLPVAALYWSRCPAWSWFKPKVSPAVVLAVTIMLYMIDCILNAMINPMYILATGGVAGCVVEPIRKRQELSDRPSASRSLAQQR